MKHTFTTMGMPAAIEIIDKKAEQQHIQKIIVFFQAVDNRFSTYKATSEISLINAGKITAAEYSSDMKEVLMIAEKTKRETDGFFNITRNKTIDPSGIVKGWAIWKAANILKELGYINFYLDIGADIEISGKSTHDANWRIGIRNPFKPTEIVKVLSVTNCGIATSGTYERGNHIYNPHTTKNIFDIVSLTIIGPTVLEADRFATAAFAMGRSGIEFIEQQKNIEGYMIDKNGIATYTSNFLQFTSKSWSLL